MECPRYGWEGEGDEKEENRSGKKKEAVAGAANAADPRGVAGRLKAEQGPEERKGSSWSPPIIGPDCTTGSSQGTIPLSPDWGGPQNQNRGGLDSPKTLQSSANKKGEGEKRRSSAKKRKKKTPERESDCKGKRSRCYYGKGMGN